MLIWDLEHPERFYLIFTRPQWRSWLVKGAVVIVVYSAVLALHFGAALLGWPRATRALATIGVPASAMAAIYTAYLFAQAKARDLWQNPLLPGHLLIQAVIAGAAVLLPIAMTMEASLVQPLLWTLAGSTLAHLLAIWGETTLDHTTAHAHLAVFEMTRGRFKRYFWTGIAAGGVAVLAPLVGATVVPFALAGLIAYEHAYVQSGQSVPLA